MILLTGFGAFGSVVNNASAALVQAIHNSPIPGLRTMSLTLPVSYTAAVQELDQCLEELSPDEKPQFILSLGVHRGDYFRLEVSARGTACASAPDNDGLCAQDVKPCIDGELSTALDLPSIIDDTLKTLASLQDILEDNFDYDSVALRLSQDAGGYVCERLYLHALYRAQALNIDALFLHVPRLESMSMDQQLPVLRQLLLVLSKRF